MGWGAGRNYVCHKLRHGRASDLTKNTFSPIAYHEEKGPVKHVIPLRCSSMKIEDIRMERRWDLNPAPVPPINGVNCVHPPPHFIVRKPGGEKSHLSLPGVLLPLPSGNGKEMDDKYGDETLHPSETIQNASNKDTPCISLSCRWLDFGESPKTEMG